LSDFGFVDVQAPVIGGDRERITVLFDEFGYRTLSMAAVHEHGLLEVTEAAA
jgi:ATP-dependent DNA helicase RecQ